MFHHIVVYNWTGQWSNPGRLCDEKWQVVVNIHNRTFMKRYFFENVKQFPNFHIKIYEGKPSNLATFAFCSESFDLTFAKPKSLWSAGC